MPFFSHTCTRSLKLGKLLGFLLPVLAVFANPASHAEEAPVVTLETNMGAIVIELNQEKAPITAANFLQYVDDGFYDGTLFHRVINNFMIQGGGFDINMLQKQTRDPITNEADNGLKNVVGSVAMARTNDPHSASSQFFINIQNNGFLDHTAKNARGWGYAVFGQVIEGMEVVDNIKVVATGMKHRHADVPVSPVTIDRAYRGHPDNDISATDVAGEETGIDIEAPTPAAPEKLDIKLP